MERENVESDRVGDRSEGVGGVRTTCGNAWSGDSVRVGSGEELTGVCDLSGTDVSMVRDEVDAIGVRGGVGCGEGLSEETGDRWVLAKKRGDSPTNLGRKFSVPFWTARTISVSRLSSGSGTNSDGSGGLVSASS